MPSLLFTPLQLRSVMFKNRIGVAPMCQYSCRDGLASNWHLVHLGSRAVGGAGMVMVEASAVSPEGRISPADLGIWSDAHAAALAPIAQFIAEQGAVPAIQLAHAGRKGSTQVPWQGRQAVAPEHGGWPVRAPSPVPFNDVYPLPAEMSEADITQVVDDFAAAAQRSRAAGMQVVELHMGHGYLMHQFLSPLSNRRADAYGGSFDARIRAPLRVAAAVREAWPRDLPLFVRLSATDWLEGGWDVAQSVELARRMKALGVDLVDCSSGSIVPGSQGEAAPGYQVPLAERIRREAEVATAAVGLITQAAQAEQILRDGSADMVLLARELLRDPYWPLRAAAELDAPTQWPVQYLRAVAARG
ncbi:NADH:flavin oxidoreductase/NADH oxidase [Bordetella petrii]|uniref:NADH:flavin oxidoreductase/NADH oxidase n=1 Tax=Bordetella petrii TaxID=94624 RepID=UPI0004B53B7C|nr:NADH:flavin oxidoreductase/NADH oxidase [Bordetella petrii]